MSDTGGERFKKWPLLLVYGALLLGLWWHRGTVVSPDSRTYAAWAGALLESGWNYHTLWGSTSTAPTLLYSGIVSVIAVCRVMFGEHWTDGLAFFNIVCLTAICWVAMQMAEHGAPSRTAPLLACGLFVICFDLSQWSRYALSDISYTLLACCVLALSSTMPHNLPRYLPRHAAPVAAVVLAIGGTFYRPTGVLLWPAVLMGLFCRYQAEKKRALPGFKLLVSLAAALVALAMLANARLMAAHLNDAKDAKGTVAHQARHYKMGEVVWDRPGTWMAEPTDSLDCLKITVARAVWFWSPVCREFSTSHNLINLIFFVPAYFLALASLADLARSRPVPPQGHIYRYTLITFIVTTWAFHSIIQVDYDWRYRVPILPAIIILGALWQRGTGSDEG